MLNNIGLQKMPEYKKSKLFIPIIGAATVLASATVAYIYFSSRPTGDISGMLTSAKIIPDEALMATYVSTNPQAWAKLQQLTSDEAQKQAIAMLEKNLQGLVKQDGFTNSNISYENDLKPWVKDVTIATLPANEQNPGSGNVLMVVGIKDKASALSFANKIKAQSGINTKETEYKNEKIIESAGNSQWKYSVVLNDHLVLSPALPVLQQAIDTAKGEPSFASREGVSSTISKGASVSNPIAQIYIPDVQQWREKNPNTSLLTPLWQLKQYKSVAASVGVEDTGMRLKAIASLNPQAKEYKYKTTNNQVVSQFPTETIALLSGQDISHAWSDFVEKSKEEPELKQGIEQIRASFQSFGLDFDKDAVGWMNGEYGLAAIPVQKGGFANSGLGFALIMDTRDRKTAEATLSKLDDLGKQKLPINISQSKIGDKNITQWKIQEHQTILTHGWLDNDTAFLALGDSIAETLVSKKNNSLSNNQIFKAAVDTLPRPNLGYFYIDSDKGMQLLSTLGGQSISSEANAILSSISGIGITATSPEKSTSQLEMFLALKGKNKK